MSSKLPQSEIDYQLARPHESNCVGLPTYVIVFLSIVTVAVALRLWARSIAKVPWKSDDYTLLVGWVSLPYRGTLRKSPLAQTDLD